MALPADGHGERLEASYRNLERGILWIGNADNKALIGLTFQGAILAGMAAMGDPLRTAMEQQRSDCLAAVEILLLTGFGAALGWSLWMFFHSLFPDVTLRDKEEAQQSPFVFGTIAAMSLDTFRLHMHALQAESIEEELIPQTYVIADIASRKFRNLRTAYQLFAPELILLAATVILAEACRQA
jgi:Family of unknown function (DUF5706)